jgi:hypothetical protein
MPAIAIAAFCVIGGYALVTHSFAASSTPEFASGYTGKCLDDLRNATTDGSIVDLFTCNGTAAQQWTWSSSGKQITIHSKCLDLKYPTKDTGEVSVLRGCNGSNSQNWKQDSSGRLVNGLSNLCLNAPDSRDGFQLQQWTCDQAHIISETWTFTHYNPSTASGTPQIASLGVLGKCIDDFHNSTANSNKVDIWTCNGTAAQQWTMNANGRIMVHGKCLDVYQNKAQPGTRVDLYACKSSGFANQQWTYEAGQGGWLVSKLSKQSATLCLTPSGPTNGDTLQIATCSPNAVHKWKMNTYQANTGSAGSSSAGGSAGGGGGTTTTAEIKSLLVGGTHCLDDFQNISADRAVVDTFTCNGTAAQHWTYNASTKYVSVNGKCLDVKAGGKADGTVVILYTCHNAANQKWTYNASAKTFTNANSGTCLNVPGPRTSGDPYNGLQLQIWKCDGRGSEKWDPSAHYVPATATGSTNSSANPPASAGFQGVTSSNPTAATDALKTGINTGNGNVTDDQVPVFNFPTPTPPPANPGGCLSWMSFFCGNFSN